MRYACLNVTKKAHEQFKLIALKKRLSLKDLLENIAEKEIVNLKLDKISEEIHE
jgi:hypothetical protein